MCRPSSLTRGSLARASFKCAAWYSNGSSTGDRPYCLLHRLAGVGHETKTAHDCKEPVGERRPCRPRFEIVPVELLTQRPGVLEDGAVVEVVLGERRQLGQQHICRR